MAAERRTQASLLAKNWWERGTSDTALDRRNEVWGDSRNLFSEADLIRYARNLAVMRRVEITEKVFSAQTERLMELAAASGVSRDKLKKAQERVGYRRRTPSPSGNAS